MRGLQRSSTALVALCAIVSIGCSGQKLDRDQAANNMQSQAEEMSQALVAGHHQKMVDFIIPKLVDAMGGRKTAIATLDYAMDQINRKGIQIKSVTFTEKPDLLEGEDAWYGVARYNLELNGLGGIRIHQKTFMVGVSHDGGKNWKFVDGPKLEEDKNNLKKFLPNFPKELALPAREQPVIEKS